MKTITAIILAGGLGTRAQTNKPKQYMPINGISVLRQCVTTFLKHPSITDVQVVIGSNDMEAYNQAVGDLPLCPPVFGGKTRSQSSRSGLSATKSPYVLIHDSARPFVDNETITRVVSGLDTADAVVPCLAITDSLKSLDGSAIDRDAYKSVQTPQGFKTDLLKDAYKNEGDFSDDATAIQDISPILFVQGDDRNIKMTTQNDFIQKTPRVGYGYDVHAFCDGEHLMLCGVKVPHGKGFLAHSDGDVAMHALTDAIYGALADGDIGHHFPPSDEQWRGASSDIFLKHAMELLHSKGGSLCNADITIVCEQPKIGPHREDMRQKLANIMGQDISKIAIKATTSEQLGFTGRGEGITTHATVMILL